MKAAEDLVGREIDGFRIESVLGRGGMGVVYRATELALHRSVAFKVLPANLASDSDFIARFYREARAAAKLNHANVVTIHRVGFDQGIYYIAMELIEGQDLKQLIAARPHLPFDEILSYARQVAEALGFAHERGVLHRDIKPPNVMIDGNGRVKVMDFGIAKLFSGDGEDHAAEDTYATQVGSFIGTPTHMPPERWNGEDANTLTDIYALGVVMYEMVSGVQPFAGKTPAHIASKVLYEEVAPVETIRPDTPAAIAAIVAKAMNRVPEKRHGSTAALIAEIDEVVAQDAIATKVGTRALPDSSAGSQRGFPWAVVVGGVIVAGLLGGAFWYNFQRLERGGGDEFVEPPSVPFTFEEMPPVAAVEPEAPVVVAPPLAETNVTPTVVVHPDPGPVPEPPVPEPEPDPLPPPNQAPVGEIHVVGDEWIEGSPIEVLFHTSDPDDDPVSLSYKLNDQGPWIQLQESRVLLKGVVVGLHRLELAVEDAKGARISATASFEVKPAPVPEPVPPPPLPPPVVVEPIPVVPAPPELPQLLASLPGHERNIQVVQFSPNGAIAASADSGGVVRLWNTDPFDERVVLEGHTAAVTGLAFSEDESLLVSAGSDGLIKFWDWENGTAVSSQKTESEGIVHLTVLPGGDVVTIDLSGTVERRNTAGVASTFEVGALNCAAIGSAEKWLVVAGEEPALRLWNLTTQSLVAELEGTLRRATLAVALSPDGLWAVSGGLDQKVVLWNLKKREEAAVWEGHESWVQGVAFSADGRRILSGGKDTTVRLWQVPDGKRLAEFTDPEKSILCVALSPQAPIGISGGVDKLLYAWRWPDGVGN